MNLKRYLTIYAALWKNSVAREMSFKGNFILWIIVELLWFGLQLTFVSGRLFADQHSIGSWTKWQMVLLVGASNFIQQVYQAFFLTNCTNLSELVRTGKMDFLLALPVNTRFIVSLRQVDLGAFVNACSRWCVMGLRRCICICIRRRCNSRLQRAVRRGDFDPLLADVHAGGDQFLDGARAGHRVGLLQSVQHRADAGRGVSSGAFKAVFTFALPVLLVSQRAGARAGGQTGVAAIALLAARPGRRLDADFGMVLAVVGAALHERQFGRFPKK
jgi:hypothetical protein